MPANDDMVELSSQIWSMRGYSASSVRGQAAIDCMLRLGYLSQETRGACLILADGGMLGPSVKMVYDERPSQITSVDFRNILENFIDTVIKMAKAIEEAVGSVPPDSSDEKGVDSQSEANDSLDELVRQLLSRRIADKSETMKEETPEDPGSSSSKGPPQDIQTSSISSDSISDPRKLVNSLLRRGSHLELVRREN